MHEPSLYRSFRRKPEIGPNGLTASDDWIATAFKQGNFEGILQWWLYPLNDKRDLNADSIENCIRALVVTKKKYKALSAVKYLFQFWKPEQAAALIEELELAPNSTSDLVGDMIDTEGILWCEDRSLWYYKLSSILGLPFTPPFLKNVIKYLLKYHQASEALKIFDQNPTLKKSLLNYYIETLLALSDLDAVYKILSEKVPTNSAMVAMLVEYFAANGYLDTAMELCELIPVNRGVYHDILWGAARYGNYDLALEMYERLKRSQLDESAVLGMVHAARVKQDKEAENLYWEEWEWLVTMHKREL